MVQVQRYQSVLPAELPPSCEDTVAEDAKFGSRLVKYGYARKMMTLKFETCKAIPEGNHDQALTIISDPIVPGEKIIK